MLVLTLVLVCTVATGIAAPIVVRALPEPVDGATARSYLSQLTVADESNSPAYSRTLSRHGTRVSKVRYQHTRMIIPNLVNGCDTREAVLKRDGTGVIVNSACTPTSGHWVSPYDDVATDLASDLDIVST